MTYSLFHRSRYRLAAMLVALTVCAGSSYVLGISPEVYDIEAARELCDSLPLQEPEGIWIYPEDGVTVLITQRNRLSTSHLPEYDIRVVETSDRRLRPGDTIGTLKATPESRKYEVEIFTERNNGLLLKPKTVIAKINEEGETMILRQEKPKFNFRFTFNPSILLPSMWRIVRLNGSGGKGNAEQPAVGMVKIYPSYDGNGSSQRSVRYL